MSNLPPAIPPLPSASAFERIMHVDEQGEYWLARELASVLEYKSWQRFEPVIKKARTACDVAGQRVSDHFSMTAKMVALGSGAERKIDDWRLSRYACYLIVQNGDPSKPVIALGQSYFAVQTRRAELADELAALSPEQQRIVMRDEVVARNVDLSAAAAAQAGLVTGKNFATFHDHGYQGLYGGETAQMIKQRKGLTGRQKILDWMDSEELAANWFRITQTQSQLLRGVAKTPDEANRAHHQMGADVRQFIIDHGGTPPEALPTPTLSVDQLRRVEADRERKRLEAERQPSLFGDLPDDHGGEN